MGKKGGNPVTGYKYSFGIHMGLSRGPLDEVVEIRVGDKTAWTGSVTDTGPLDVRAPELFGGEKQEGGIDGEGVLMMGKPDQTATPGLVAMLGHALPGFRRMVTYFFNGVIASNSPYPKPWKFRVRRALKGWDGDPWYPEKCIINLEGDPERDEEGNIISDTIAIKAMNPAHVLYELLTNREWGRGLPASALNIASFTAAADTLHAEGFGVCFRWNRRDALEAFAQAVIDHIGAVLYSDRSTALLTLKLIRYDYDPNTLPIYDTNAGMLEMKEANVSALGPAINEVVVEYTDPVSGKVRTVSNQNIASLQATRGVFNSLKKQYTGIPTAGLALRLAQRDLRTNAMALRKFTMTFDRRAWKIAPGSVMRISDPVRGINNVVVRVGRIEDGTLTEGTITITAVQDVFALPQTSFIGNEPPNWIKPNNKPILKEHRAFEVPYFLLNQTMTPADFDYLEEDSGFLGTVVAKPSDLSLAYNIFVKNGPPEPDEEPPAP
jgi:hypothetical protein